MAIDIISPNEAAAVWSERAASAGSRYAERASAAGTRWEQGASGASANYRAAVTAGGIEQRYAGGVRRAGASRYAAGVRDKGTSRYSQGIDVSQDRYVQGVQPFFQTIQGLTLPPRRPRGDAANLQRVAAVANALNARRLALSGAGARA